VNKTYIVSQLKQKIFQLLIFILAFEPSVATAQNLGVDILKEINPMYPDSQYWIQTSSSAYWVSGGMFLGLLGYGLIKRDSETKQRAFELALSIAASSVVMEFLKIAINRERPADKYPGVIFVNGEVHGQSFPSGHTTLAFATATTLALNFRKWYIVIPAYLWAGSVGYSRLYLGKHYPGDVLAGAAIGIGGGYLSHWLTREIFSKPVHHVQLY
jgi:membrane-associated phospholipid phosphatase